MATRKIQGLSKIKPDVAEFLCKTTDYWAPEFERTIFWNDPDLSIKWPLQGVPGLSFKDSEGVAFKAAECSE